MQHRGRIQAQGQKLEESEPWSQVNALLLADSISLINNLEGKIPEKDRILRVKAFMKTRKFVNQAKINGGISVVGLKNYSKTFLVRGKERVDLEIHDGIAFI